MKQLHFIPLWSTPLTLRMMSKWKMKVFPFVIQHCSHCIVLQERNNSSWKNILFRQKNMKPEKASLHTAVKRCFMHRKCASYGKAVLHKPPFQMKLLPSSFIPLIKKKHPYIKTKRLTDWSWYHLIDGATDLFCPHPSVLIRTTLFNNEINLLYFCEIACISSSDAV